MKTQPSPDTNPPAALVETVRALKRYCPYRICWGAFRPDAPDDTLTGADYDKRKFNRALRAGYVGFIV